MTELDKIKTYQNKYEMYPLSAQIYADVTTPINLLRKLSNISNDFYLLERVRKAFPDKLLYAGFDEMLLPAVALGVDGAIGSTYNVTGQYAREIFDATMAGDMKLAREKQTYLNDIIEAILSNFYNH